jgi:hypothetical protein
MLCRVDLVITGVSGEHIASIIRVAKMGKLGSTLAFLVTAKVSSSLILFTLMMEAILSPETSVLTRATRYHILEDGIHQSHRRENLKSYVPAILCDNFHGFSHDHILPNPFQFSMLSSGKCSCSTPITHCRFLQNPLQFYFL